MVDPWLASTSKRVGIRVKQLVVLNDQLTGAQVPPHIGVGDAPGRHGKEAKHKNDDKNSACFEERLHLRWIIPQLEHKVESAGLKIDS